MANSFQNYMLSGGLDHAAKQAVAQAVAAAKAQGLPAAYRLDTHTAAQTLTNSPSPKKKILQRA
jgi:hypothetical protein